MYISRYVERSILAFWFIAERGKVNIILLKKKRKTMLVVIAMAKTHLVTGF